ncbi:MAG TPA: tRNA lysidine(34) synthetase TilS [Chloroflexota bacterium]|nr:tRNA lysidine(34) synthetase TilS [Chloroflexota bacterium]
MAVSGGADSTCLLHALRGLGFRLAVAHLNHGLRGDAADADAAFVQSTCDSLAVPCFIEVVDVAAYQRREHLSLEDAARRLRYDFLRRKAAQVGATSIALAHTADDQVETLLLHLIRGAGPAGLGAMKARLGDLRRPLLRVWRTDVEAWLRERSLPWREDATNADARFLRNRVRHELLPLLATFNPAIKTVLLREARLFAARQGRVEAEVLRRLGLQATQIEQALAGKTVIASGDRRICITTTKPASPAAFDVPLPVPGSIQIAGVGTVSAELLALGTPATAAPGHDAMPYPGPGRPHHQVLVAQPPAGAGFPATQLEPRLEAACDLHVRSWRPGDRFAPAGMTGTKKLQDFFVDAKVPRARRATVPLVMCGDAIVWVAGWRRDRRWAPLPRQACLRLTFEEERSAQGARGPEVRPDHHGEGEA